MSDEPEHTAGGDRIYRHEQSREWEMVISDEDLIDAVSEHINRHIGEIAFVLHPIISEYAHIDVYVVKATDERPWITLVTSGMSARPMTPSDDLGPEFSRLELTMALPPDWPVEDRDPRHHWPFRLLQFIGTLPHEYDSWVWLGHTITNGNPPEPFAEDNAFIGALLSFPEHAGPDFASMTHGDHPIYFAGVYPLYEDEMDFKVAHGADPLEERLAAADITELLDPTRPSVA